MTSEAQIHSSLQITKPNEKLEYRSSPTAFKATVTGAKGPVPGALAITTAGVDIDFSELTQPALCRLQNLDTTNYVDYGIWDPEGGKFYPLGALLPGETYVIRLSPNLHEEFGEGAGTTGADTNRLRLKANTAACDCVVDALKV